MRDPWKIPAWKEKKDKSRQNVWGHKFMWEKHEEGQKSKQVGDQN